MCIYEMNSQIANVRLSKDVMAALTKAPGAKHGAPRSVILKRYIKEGLERDGIDI